LQKTVFQKKGSKPLGVFFPPFSEILIPDEEDERWKEIEEVLTRSKTLL